MNVHVNKAIIKILTKILISATNVPLSAIVVQIKNNVILALKMTLKDRKFLI